MSFQTFEVSRASALMLKHYLRYKREGVAYSKQYRRLDVSFYPRQPLQNMPSSRKNRRTCRDPRGPIRAPRDLPLKTSQDPSGPLETARDTSEPVRGLGNPSAPLDALRERTAPEDFPPKQTVFPRASTPRPPQNLYESLGVLGTPRNTPKPLKERPDSRSLTPGTSGTKVTCAHHMENT